MDSLFLPNENILESGIINSQNEVISSSSSNINIPISDYKIKLLKNANLFNLLLILLRQLIAQILK